jgi:methyl-accepting chemotaxis protein
LRDTTAINSRKFQLTIRSKLLLFCALLLLVPTLTLAAISYKEAQIETDALIRENLENSVKLMIQNIHQLQLMVDQGLLSLEQAQEQAKIAMLGELGQDGKRPINPNIDLGENGYYFVLDEQGNLLAHPTSEGENLWDRRGASGELFIQDMIQKGRAGGGFTFYDWPLPDNSREAVKITYSLQEPGWNWVVAAGSYYQDFDGGLQRIKYATLITVILCLLLGAIGVWLFSNHISRPIISIAAEAQKVATGDLTSDGLNVRNRDEIGKLAAAFHTMSSNLGALVKQVLDSSDQVSAATQVLRTSIDETSKASRHIAGSTQEIAAGIDSQAASTKQSSTAVEEMAKGIGQIAGNASLAFETSVRSKNEAEQGYAMISQSIHKMQSVQLAVDDIAAVMETLDKRSREIGSIVEMISGMAKQTGLLSLNASIEAARAGEHGRGFAVVAAEVKKLAEMSRNASDQVAELVHQVQSDIASAVSSAMTGKSEFHGGIRMIEQTGEVFEQIVQSVQDAAAQIEEVSAAAQQLSAGSEQIHASLQELERIAAQSAESVEMISAATEQQIATMEEIAHSSDALSKMADELKETAHRFKLKKT